MKHIDEFPVEIKQLLLKYAPELSSASREYYVLLNRRQPYKLSPIEMLPISIKLRILWFASDMRFASREWYCLHNELYRKKCKQLETDRWTFRHLTIARQVQHCCPGFEPLRRLCCQHYRRASTCCDANEIVSVLPYVSDSWYYIYKNLQDCVSTC
ncbi:uncharacterized protein Ecym_5453 [Eremothecium cymbalariae DBVPG|uniref:Uncharacterized protein n=1 Tax=Eremothecium cymbalariae (strain CBS 270.75 / DBVPG 7215 / KCTC 17166 / NRRL Y-17582) TaxID=931890 RepID=I6NDR0_ERECY|nr:hypothetical protein Ecym_5453 [Eremothecium cymbalariae DBVPG\